LADILSYQWFVSMKLPIAGLILITL